MDRRSGNNAKIIATLTNCGKEVWMKLLHRLKIDAGGHLIRHSTQPVLCSVMTIYCCVLSLLLLPSIVDLCLPSTSTWNWVTYSMHWDGGGGDHLSAAVTAFPLNVRVSTAVPIYFPFVYPKWGSLSMPTTTMFLLLLLLMKPKKKERKNWN